MAPTFFCYNCDHIVGAQELTDGNFMCNECGGNFIEIREEQPPQPQPQAQPSPPAIPFLENLSNSLNTQPTSVVHNPNGSVTYTFSTIPVNTNGGGNSLNAILGQIMTGLLPQVPNGDYFNGNMDQLLDFLMRNDPNRYGPPPTSADFIRNMVRRHPTPRELASSPECSVCESELTLQDTVVCLPCKHLFHPECIIPWIKDHNTCPTCRATLPEMTSADDRYNENEHEHEHEYEHEHGEGREREGEQA